MGYRNTDSLNRRIESLRQPFGSGGIASGLAQAIRSRKANKLERELEQTEASNQQNQQRELAMILRGQQTGRVGDSYASATAEQFTPSDPELRQITAKMLMERATGSNTPSNVREWEYYSKLPEDQQERYLTMRRGTSPMNLGDQFVIPSAVSPGGAPRASFPVGLRPGELPSVQGAQTAAREEAEIAAIPERAQAELDAELAANSANTRQTRSRDASNTIEILDMAAPLLEVATGSGVGAARDQVGAAFGVSGEGAQAAAQLQALSGRLIMMMPRMEGPQSNMDQQLYRQMAGQIGDSTIPNETRMAAIETIRALAEKYANQGAVGAVPAGARLRFNVATGELE